MNVAIRYEIKNDLGVAIKWIVVDESLRQATMDTLRRLNPDISDMQVSNPFMMKKVI